MKKRLSMLCAFALVVTLSTGFTTFDSSSNASSNAREQMCGT